MNLEWSSIREERYVWISFPSFVLMSGPYLMSAWSSSILCGLQKRREDVSRASAYRRICFTPSPALYRYRLRVDSLTTPGAAQPSISRVLMIWRADRFGTSRFRMMASPTISSQLSGRRAERRILRFMGRSPANAFSRYLFSYR